MDRMIITDQMIEDGMSDNGSWSFKQIMLLGFGRHRGWRRRAIGKEILTERYTEFLALKNAHLKNKKKHNNSVLTKSIAFIIENFTHCDKFHCPHRWDCVCDCDNCDTKKTFIEITGIED